MGDGKPVGVGMELRVRLAADPASVSGARRFVADGLAAWGRSALVDDATLCVSELAGNAALHSASTFMEIAMRALDGAVRISVEDDGVTPAETVAPRPGWYTPDLELDENSIEDEPTTGRGLAIVSILASDWGVEQLDYGKRVWAELSESGEEHQVRRPTTGTAPAEQNNEVLPDGWALVRLLSCPVELSLRQDAHLDELVRELQLIEGDDGNPRSLAIALELGDILTGPAQARHTGRRITQEAAESGQEFVDVEMAMPREFSIEVRKLDAAVRAADELCEQMRLLTLASPADLRALRAWMTESIVEQIELGAEPVSWTDWVSRRS